LLKEPEEQVEQCLNQIRDLLNSTTEAIQENSNYIAFEIMENDPLNEKSVEYLRSQAALLIEQCDKCIDE